MCIQFSTIYRPKSVAKSLKALLNFGYRNWHELANFIPSPPTLDDANISTLEIYQRRAFQITTLVRKGLPQNIAASIIACLHPTRSLSDFPSDQQGLLGLLIDIVGSENFEFNL